MRFSLITLTACVLLGGQVLASPIGDVKQNDLVARDTDDFCVYFYKKPNQQEQAGFICGSLDSEGEGNHVGRPNANIPVVGSLTAPDWLQITVYDKHAYQGHSKTFQGNQDNISPTLNVQSFKLVHK
ncbi:uncharacterized protein BX664DRAFT_341686 [Halteromyces radiatus]|uniref:uncharacterized protein n=1 Tax=Halteromyces radiatus TaxID=101107 RepID=UPI00221E708A|nr:uncharacterized protein BX664DRAFT_341686 [Halteromyces radiatus]KAI8079880.1 hypothetical protein BX664DRAFT_341686 [Halteromyces radiatus]